MLKKILAAGTISLGVAALALSVSAAQAETTMNPHHPVHHHVTHHYHHVVHHHHYYHHHDEHHMHTEDHKPM